jgi:outer membrane protein assembly factor BamC
VSRRFPFLRSLPLAAALAGLAACSSINEKLQGDKVDYRSTGSKSVTLEVPPDLSQLSRDSRYQPTPDGTISASTIQSAPSPGAAASSPSGPGAVAPSTVGDFRLERAGSQRWLVTKQTPEQLWPQLQAFWQERGFALEIEQREAGVMETDWVENRAKIPQDMVRNIIGKVFDGMYDSGERDRFRTRIERGPDGTTEIYISHRGVAEVYTGSARDGSTAWQPRPSDPELEALMLSRLMLKLGGQEEQAKAMAANGAASAASPSLTAPRARLVNNGAPGAGLQVDDAFDRAWRRVGLALDRSGFTVEDRDRAQGLYFVRYVDPKQRDKGEPGFFSKLFGANDDARSNLSRYRISLKGQADSTFVTVLDNQGAPETGDAAQRILERLATDLR